MPLNQMMNLAQQVGSVAGISSIVNPLLAPLGIIGTIIEKMATKKSLIRRLLGMRSKIIFAYMPKYKPFICSVCNEKVKEKCLLIDFEDYVKTILNADEVTQFYNFVNDKSDNDLYREIVLEMVNKMFSNQIETSKKIIYFLDNEKIFKLITKKRKVYIYPKTPDEADIKFVFSSLVENIKKKLMIYKSYTDLETQLLHL
jgi:hypothetical protein